MSESEESNRKLPDVEPERRRLLQQLIHACKAGSVDEVLRLIEQGAPINEWRFGNAPLPMAAAMGRIDIANLLLDSGADVNLRPNRPLFWTPLIAAADRGHLDMVELLIARGADVLAHTDPDNPATTAKFYAMNKRNPALIAVLEQAERKCRSSPRNGVRAGVDSFDSNSLLLLVRAPVHRAGDALIAAAASPGGSAPRREAGLLGRELTLGRRAYLIFQYRGNDWTLIAPLTSDTFSDPIDNWAARISKEFSTEAILYNNSDDPTVRRYQWWQSGHEVESYSFRADDVGDDPATEEVSPKELQRRYKQRIKAGEGSTFRSDIRQAAPGDPEEFITAFMRERGVYIPPIDTARSCAGQSIQLSFLDSVKDDLVRVDLVTLH